MKCGFVPSAEHHRYELEGLVFIVEWTLARSMYDSPLSANCSPSRMFSKAVTRMSAAALFDSARIG
jgi:hypothetical protein